jgi:hypothetical protein
LRRRPRVVNTALLACPHPPPAALHGTPRPAPGTDGWRAFGQQLAEDLRDRTVAGLLLWSPEILRRV